MRPGRFNPGGFYQAGARRNRRGGPDAYMMLLIAQLVQQISRLEHKPPVTLAVMAGEDHACTHGD